MVKVTRSNPQAFQQLITRLKELDGLETKAGWFETAKYENGEPIAGIAAAHEFGAHINHPGGTPYKIGADGKAIFVSKNSPNASSLPVTKPHTIIIPPRPFMRPTAEREILGWTKILAAGAKAIARGAATGFQVMDALGSKVTGDIAKSMADVTAPPLKRSTIRARMRRLTDQKTMGLLDKPLVDSGMMLNTVTHTTEKKQ